MSLILIVAVLGDKVPHEYLVWTERIEYFKAELEGVTDLQGVMQQASATGTG